MAVIDIVILAVFAGAVITGYRKGFIAQAGSLAAIVVAIVACRLLGPAVTDFILANHEGEISSVQRYCTSALAYCGVYIVAYYAVILVVKLLKLIVHTMLLGPLDSIGGALVSLLKWFMALSIAANLSIALSPNGNWLTTSTLGSGRPVHWVVKLAPNVLGIVSEQLHFDSLYNNNK